MCVQVTIYGQKICTLSDREQRNVLSLRCYKMFLIKARPSINRSIAEVLQGVVPKGPAVMGGITVPVLVGNQLMDVNFIMADTGENTDIIPRHNFLLQAQTCLDYGHRKITFFG